MSFPHSVKTFSHILCIWWLLKLTLKISRKFNIGIPWETSQILKGLFAKMCENSSQWIFVKLQSWTCIFSPGLDNAFVILNSWHRSDKKASVEDRLGDTMAEAGVSRTWYYTDSILHFRNIFFWPLCCHSISLQRWRHCFLQQVWPDICHYRASLLQWRQSGQPRFEPSPLWARVKHSTPSPHKAA